jgi:hypothetical protein
MDSTTNQSASASSTKLTDYVIQSLKHGIPATTIRKALAQNNLDEATLDQIIAAAQDHIAHPPTDDASTKAADTPPGENDKSAAALPSDSHEYSAASSVGAASLEQGEAVMLHQPPPKPPEPEPLPPAAAGKPTPVTESSSAKVALELAHAAVAAAVPASVSTAAPLAATAAPTPPPIAPTVPAASADFTTPATPAAPPAPQITPPPYSNEGLAPIFPAIAPAPAPAPAPRASSRSNSIPEMLSVQQALAACAVTLRKGGARYVTCLVLGAIFASSLFVLINNLIGSYFPLQFNFVLLRPAKLGSVLLGGAVFNSIYWALTISALVTLLAPVIVDSHNRRHRSFSASLTAGINGFSRVLTATAVVVAIAAVPAVIVIIVPVILLAGAHQAHLAAMVLPVLYAIAAAWVVASVSRTGLAPFAALLERVDPLKALARSRKLQGPHNRKLLYKVGAAFAAVVGAVSWMSGQSLQRVTTQLHPPVVIVCCITAILAVNILALLYDKAKRHEQ